MNEITCITVIEDNANTRTLIKNHLVAKRVGQITCYSNGAPLLIQTGIVNADIIIIGMELDNSYAGTDLIRHLARLKKLHPWTKVIFVTNQSRYVRADLPLLGQKCDVIDKPINIKLFDSVISSSIEISKIGKQTFLQLDETEDDALIKLVTELPKKSINPDTIDSIRLMQSKLLLKLRRPILIFKVLSSIQDQALKHLALMHYLFNFGQLKKLEEVLESAMEQGILKNKRNNLMLLQYVLNRDYSSALENLNKLKDAELLPPEIVVKATLLGLVKGLKEALDYLHNKRNVSLENHYYRSAITIGMMFLCFMQLVTKRDNDIDNEATYKLINELSREKSLNHPANDYKSFKPFILLACNVINGEFEGQKDKLYAQIDELIKETTNMEPIKRFILVIIYEYSGNIEAATDELQQIAMLMSDVEISPELILNYIVYDLFVETAFNNKQRAKILNKLGKSLFEKRFPAVALRLFYRSFKTAPEFTNNTLNLLSALTSTQLNNYLDTDITWLIKDLETMSLNNKQQKFLLQLKNS